MDDLFDSKFSLVIPRLMDSKRFRRDFEAGLEEKAAVIMTRLQRKEPLSSEEGHLAYDAAYTAFRENMNYVLTLGWDGNFPGNSGAVYICELAGIYMVMSSDYDPEGPFDSINEALQCECFDVVTANPELDSKTVPLTQLLAVARRVVDWENKGEIWINSKKYVVKGNDLVKEGKK